MTEDDQPEESEPVEEIALRSLDHRVQRQIENAKKSIVSGNFDYAFEICMNILRQHPGCLDVRKVLRRAQVAKRKAASKKSSKFLDKVTSAPFSIMGSSLVKKDPERQWIRPRRCSVIIQKISWLTECWHMRLKILSC